MHEYGKKRKFLCTYLCNHLLMFIHFCTLKKWEIYLMRVGKSTPMCIFDWYQGWRCYVNLLFYVLYLLYQSKVPSNVTQRAFTKPQIVKQNAFKEPSKHQKFLKSIYFKYESKISLNLSFVTSKRLATPVSPFLLDKNYVYFIIYT